MSIRAYLPFAKKILSFVAKLLLLLEGEENEIVIFVKGNKRVKIVCENEEEKE